MKAVKKKTLVGKKGTIELQSTELKEGMEVEIIILIPSVETELDTTEYLLSTEANRRELLEAVERVEKQENLVQINSEEWHEKYSF
jgi:antitoxin YefM